MHWSKTDQTIHSINWIQLSDTSNGKINFSLINLSFLLDYHVYGNNERERPYIQDGMLHNHSASSRELIGRKFFREKEAPHSVLVISKARKVVSKYSSSSSLNSLRGFFTFLSPMTFVAEQWREATFKSNTQSFQLKEPYQSMAIHWNM